MGWALKKRRASDRPVLINFRANYLEIVVSKFFIDWTLGRRGAPDRPIPINFRATYLKIVVSKVLRLDYREQRSSR